MTFSPGHGIDFYAVGLIIMGIGSTVSAINPDRHRAQHAFTGR